MKSTSTHSVRRALASVTVVGLLALSACGSDEDANGGSADTATVEEFCSELGKMDTGDGSSAATDLQSLAESAP